MSNLIYNTAKDLYEQMQLVKKCNESDLDAESKRLTNMSAAASQIANFAKEQVNLYIQTGTLPEHNLIFASEEKVVTSTAITQKPKKLKNSLLIEEFTK